MNKITMLFIFEEIPRYEIYVKKNKLKTPAGKALD